MQQVISPCGTEATIAHLVTGSGLVTAYLGLCNQSQTGETTLCLSNKILLIYTLFIEEAYLACFTTLIYHKVLINNKTEQDTTYRYKTFKRWY